MLVSNLIDEISNLPDSPTDIQRLVADLMEDHQDGRYAIVDPTNPLAFLLEVATATSTAQISKIEAGLRSRYPSMCRDFQELYHHMSDKDYLDRFATPSRSEFTLWLDKNEINRLAVLGDNDIRKVVIPADTYFTVNGLRFAIENPIEIRVMAHGGMQVVWDLSNPTQLHPPESNILDWDMMTATIDGRRIELLQIVIPAYQYKVDVYNSRVSGSTRFKETYEFTDQFYHARVWVMENGDWAEIKTTHSDQVYNPRVATAVLKVLENSVEVTIPQIYQTNGLVKGPIRVDVLSTRGDINLAMDRYSPEAFGVKWEYLSIKPSAFIDAFMEHTQRELFSIGFTEGGSNGLTFDDMLARVINNSSNVPDVPITPTQFNSKLENMGYSVIKQKDTITSRLYLAAKALPPPTNGSTATSIGVTMDILESNLEYLQNNVQVHNNGERVTIKSGSLLKFDLSKLILLSTDEYNQLITATPDTQLSTVQNERLAILPFHYVLDTTNDNFETRAYYLDNPTVLNKQFVKENQSTGIVVATGGYELVKAEDGYLLNVRTNSGKTFKSLDNDQVFVQLSYKPVDEYNNAYINGDLLAVDEDGERLYQFKLGTNFDFDEDNNILLSSFSMFGSGSMATKAKLVTDFEITYIVSDYSKVGLTHSELDSDTGGMLLPASTYAISREKLSLKFGDALTSLWRGSRSTVGSNAYEVYETDEIDVYEHDVYAEDEYGAIVHRDADTGEVIYNKIHAAGDPKLNPDGSVRYKHKVGWIKLDADQKPIVKTERAIIRHSYLLLLDGAYAFANDVNATEAYRETVERMVNWITKDISRLDGRLLENTDIWFYPKTAMGSVPVIVKDGARITMDSEQSVKVEYYLSKLVYDNLELRTSLNELALKTVSDHLTRSRVSISAIVEDIRKAGGDDIIDVTVSGIGGDEYSLITIDDDSRRFNLKKRLQLLPDGTVMVEDDLTVSYVQHV